MPRGLGRGQRIDGKTEVIFWGGGNILYFHFDVGYTDISIVKVVQLIFGQVESRQRYRLNEMAEC